MVDEVVSLINESKGTELRLFNIAAPIWQYLLGEHKELNEVFWKYIDVVENNNPEIANIIYNTYAKDVSQLKQTAADYRYWKVAKDKSYQKQVLSELLSKKEISADDFIILKEFSNLKDIGQWVNSGGIITGEEEIAIDFSNLQLNLLTLANEKHPIKIEKTEKVRLQAETTIAKYHDKLASLNPFLLLELAESLSLYPELSESVCDLIKPILPATDIWVSRIVECYLNALLSSQQLMTLASVLSNIKKSEWNSFVWRVQSHHFLQQYDYGNAINSIEEAIKLDSSLLDAWHTLIWLHRAVRVSDESLALILKRIPNELLAKNSDMAFNLVIEMAKTGDFERAESILISWFIENPTTSAIAITDFYTNFIIGSNALILTPEKIGSSVFGVVFKKDNMELTKLLVDNVVISHPCLLDFNSDLGQILKEIEVGETKQCGMDDITLIERLPPYIAALRISSDLRQDKYHGADGFCVFKVPDNPDEIMTVIKRKLSIFNGDKKKKDEILNNSELPLMFKGKWLNSHNPLNAIFELFLTKTVKHQLPNFGVENPVEVILDIYAIVYLTLTGLIHGITQSSIKLIITEETKFVTTHPSKSAMLNA
jgi:hypothetical protein